MGIFGGSKSQSKPSPEARWAAGSLIGYLTGPQQLGDSKAHEAAQLFGPAGAGQLPGSILPDWNELNDIAGETYFDYLSNPQGNGILRGALDSAFAPAQIDYGMGSMPNLGGGMGGGFGGGFGGGGILPKIIPNSATQNALNTLQNPPSPFDIMSGGPIVNEINQRTNAEDAAYRDRAMADLTEALEISFANDMSTGLMSGSTIGLNRERITTDVLSDLNAFRATRSLEQTKYLGDLAMQDVLNRTNSAQRILEQALIEKGIDSQHATAMASIAAEQATQLAVAQLRAQTDMYNTRIGSQTSLAINNQNRLMDLLNMGYGDYTGSIDRRLGVGMKPLDILAQIVTGMPGVQTGKTDTNVGGQILGGVLNGLF